VHRSESLPLLRGGRAGLTYSPGWHHPMAYWDAIVFTLSAIFLIRGVALRRGSNEFISY